MATATYHITDKKCATCRWWGGHEEEAYAAWNLAVQGKSFKKIVAAM